MTIDNQLIAEKLRYKMNEIGITPVQLADMAEVGKSLIYDILKGCDVNPTATKLSAIAKVLGVQIPYFFTPMNENGGVNAILVDLLEAEDGVLVEKGAICVDGKLINTSRDYLRAAKVVGDAMHPTLLINDVVLVNTRAKTGVEPGLFLLFHNNNLIVKRLELMAGAFPDMARVISDNPFYNSYDVPLISLHIIGKVIGLIRSSIN